MTARPEPFRAMLEQAFLAEGRIAPRPLGTGGLMADSAVERPLFSAGRLSEEENVLEAVAIVATASCESPDGATRETTTDVAPKVSRPADGSSARVEEENQHADAVPQSPGPSLDRKLRFAEPTDGCRLPSPRMLKVLEDTAHHGFSASGDNNASAASVLGRSSVHSDRYRLHLAVDDTPPRPLPSPAAAASTSLVPANALGDALERVKTLAERGDARLGPRSTSEADTTAGAAHAAEDDDELAELESIADIESMAQALGLRWVGDGLEASSEDLGLGGTAAKNAAIGVGPRHESMAPVAVHADDAAELRESVFATGEYAIRPAAPSRAPNPVIVRIPSRRKVTASDRARARKLYLNALEELGRGDKAMAVGNLRFAVETDDTVALYKDLLAQLERGTASRAKLGSVHG